MRIVFLYTLSAFLLLQGDTLPEKILSLDPAELNGTVKIVTPAKSKEQKRVDKLKDASKKTIDGITIEVFEANISKDTSISVDYAPTLKKGELIDNQEKTTIKLKYKF